MYLACEDGYLKIDVGPQTGECCLGENTKYETDDWIHFTNTACCEHGIVEMDNTCRTSLS